VTRLIPLLTLGAAACGSAAFPTVDCRALRADTCVEVDPLDASTSLQELVNGLTSGTTVVLGQGTFELDNQVTFRNADQIALVGQGMDRTLLDFGSTTVQANGVDIVGQGVLVEDLTIQDAPKDGLRIEDSTDVVIRRVRTTWSAGPVSENGGYGIYPVRSDRVLIEDSEAFHAADAGIYVGQCVGAVVRNNLARANVAGLEIENTQNADVYGNVVEDNTGGLVVFDLPGNPVVGRDVRIHDNIIRDNNRANFAPGGVVSQIPAGTGTFAMASRRVEITNNTYENNDTVDIAIISGMVVESDPLDWAIPRADLVGDVEGLVLDELPDDRVANFRTTEVWVHGNTHEGGGTAPDNGSEELRPLGYLLAFTYRSTPVDAFLYDGIGESSFHPEDATQVSNDHHICVQDVPGMATLDLEGLTAAGNIPSLDDLYRPDAPFAPYDCTGFTEGELVMPDFLDE
jgi:parallel beta-helix repeat protein